MKLSVLISSLLGIFLVTLTKSADAQIVYTTLNDPNATGSTVAEGISGNDIVGYYTDSTVTNVDGFLYNGSTYTTLDDPNATQGQIAGPNGTYATGISGSTVVGYYFEGLGTHGSGSTSHGFIYNGSTYETIDDPKANSYGTVVTGISGNNIVGYYFFSGGAAGFEFNGSTYGTI